MKNLCLGLILLATCVTAQQAMASAIFNKPEKNHLYPTLNPQPTLPPINSQSYYANDPSSANAGAVDIDKHITPSEPDSNMTVPGNDPSTSPGSPGYGGGNGAVACPYSAC